jgi:hypothetical protein
MPLGLGHKRNEGAHITHLPTGKTIDLVVVNFNLSFGCAKLEAFGIGNKELMLERDKYIEIAEGLTIGISKKWNSSGTVSISYKGPKDKYDIHKVCYPPYLRENLRKEYLSQNQ